MPQLMPGNSLGFLLTDVSRLFRQAFEKAVLEAGLELTAGEIRALAHVARNEGSRQATLAERMGVEPMTLSAYLDRLENRGLIARTTDATDRRAKVIRTTDEATRVFGDVRPIAIRVYEHLTRGISEPDRQLLEQMLVTIRENLTNDLEVVGEEAGLDAPSRVTGAA